jgi:hypothetical protein
MPQPTPLTASSLPDLLKAIKASTQGRPEPETHYERGWGRERFIRENLASVMTARWFFGRGPKRIRKKRAKAYLYGRALWKHLGPIMAEPLRLRRDYASVGRLAFSVTPLGPASG